MGISIEILDAPYHRTMLAHDYAIINAMQVEPEARADLDGRSIVPARHREKAHLFPLLVELRALTDHQRFELLNRMSSWQATRGIPYFSALLACPDNSDVLLRHLIQRCDVVLPNGEPDVLRLHDPRFFRHLVRILRPEQHDALLANIHRWTWPEPDGTWRSIVHPDGGPAGRLKQLRFDDSQWAQMLRLPNLQAVLAALQRTAPALAHDNKLVQRVDAVLTEAERQWPNACASDRQLFAEHAICYGEKLHHHTQFQARMALVRTGEQGYFSAFADLDDETLRAWATPSEFAKECS